MSKNERLEAAIDRLDSCITSLTSMTMLPDSIHVGALRELLPEIAIELRALLPRPRTPARAPTNPEAE